MNGGNITVDLALRGAQKFSADMKKAQQDVRAFEASAATQARALNRAAIGISVAAIAANRLGTSLKQLGREGSFASRGGGFLAAFTSGDIGGAVKAAGESTRLTKEQIQQLGSSSTVSAQQVNQYVTALNAIGQSDAAAALREIRAELVATNALNAFNASTLALTRRPDDDAGEFGRGPGAIARSNAIADARKDPNRGFGMSSRLRAAVAIARTTPGKADEIAQLRRASRQLTHQLRSGALKTNEARIAVAQELEAVQDELTTLTKKERDVEKKRARKKRAALSFIELDPASQVGALGAGPFVSSDVMSFARSFGYKPTAGDFLRDIREQTRQALRFERDLGRLSARGLPQSVVDELRLQGIGAAEQVAALAGAPKGVLSQFGKVAAHREAVGERLQVGTLRADIGRADIVIQNGRVAGIDRNRNGQLDRGDRFAIEAGARRA